MNILERLLRLPVVSKGPPVLKFAVFGALGLLTVIRNVKGPSVIPMSNRLYNIERHSPFSLGKVLIQIFSDKRPNRDIERWSWFLLNTAKFTRYLFSQLFSALREPETTNIVSQNEVPSLIAGHIDSRHLVNNMQGKTFVIGISEQVLLYMALFVIVFKTIALYFLISSLFGFFSRRLKTHFSSITVESKEVKNVLSSQSENNKSTFISNYLNKQS